MREEGAAGRRSLQRQLADEVCRLAALDDLRITLAGGAKVNEPVTLGLRPLHYACWQNYVDAVRFLLVRGSDVDATDDVGYSALHLSAEHGHLEVVRVLLEHGARVNFRGKVTGGSLPPPPEGVEDPLHLAVKNGHYEVARLLLEHGADPNARYFLGSQINLVGAADLPFLELLLAFGAHPDARDRNGLTPLMRAARLPDGLQSVLLLTSFGADVNAVAGERSDRRSVLHYAVLGGNREIMRFLLKQGARVRFDGSYERPTPLDLAVLKGDAPLIAMLIDRGADVNRSSPAIGAPLQIACTDSIPNRLEILRLLLGAGADPNLTARGEDGSALRPALAEYLASNEVIDPEVVDLLLRHGAKVVMTSSYRDHRGIFHALGKLKDSPGVFLSLLNAAEKFDAALIRRNSAISEFQRAALLRRACLPLPLMHQLRLFFRRLWAAEATTHLEHLPLPRFLKKYLAYEVS